MAGRCADGAERDGGRRTHLVPFGVTWGRALCGAEPGRRFSNGWSEVDGPEVPTCPRCQAKAARLGGVVSNPCSHVWINPAEPLAERATYSPVVGPSRYAMKDGQTYRCQRCGMVLTIDVAADVRARATGGQKRK